MKIAVGEKAENHLEENNILNDNQTSYTKGGRMEHNFLTLQYHVENTYQEKSLIVTAVDYKKTI